MTARSRQPARLTALLVGWLLVAGAATGAAGRAAAADGDTVREDARACNALHRSRRLSSFEAYLRRFPNGLCAGYARVRVSVLRGHRPTALAGDASVLKPGTQFRDCADCPPMVVVPAGDFVMGSPDNETGRDSDEGPQHRVAFSTPFAVGQAEVTNAEFVVFLNAVAGHGGGSHGDDHGDDHGDGGDHGIESWIETRADDADSRIRSDGHGGYAVIAGFERHPVTEVSWYGARAFARWLAARSGKAYRLPSEAEWEYAARAWTTTPFYTGRDISGDDANFDGRYGYRGAPSGQFRRTTTVAGSFAANPFGLYDMHGNVWEWVGDCWTATYDGAPADGATATDGDCTRRVLRGGSAFNEPAHLRSAFRYWATPDNRTYYIGFRVARQLMP